MSSANTSATFCATLVDEWAHHGIRTAVIAPGSRSTPLALALTNNSNVQVHTFHDERTASFAALGVGLGGSPAILLCTSGTAAAHFHAAVIEAHQAGVPMIVCTADRPPELRDVGAPQTIDQTKLYGNAVRWFHEPGVADEQACATWRPLAAHAYAMACGSLPGPVHLNLAFREPLIGVADALPARLRRVALTPPAHTFQTDPWLVQKMSCNKGVIIAGQGCRHAAGDVAALGLHLGWPVLADSRSGLGHHTQVAVTSANELVLDQVFAADYVPELIVRLGEPPASKTLNSWLVSSGAPQIHVTATPRWIDPDGAIAHRVVADIGVLC